MNPLTTALSNIRRSPYQALVATLMMSVTFAVLFALSFFFTAAHIILHYYETQPQIIAFFSMEATPAQIEQGKKTIEQKPYVKSVVLTSKEDALKLYTKEFKDSPLLLELVTSDILPASIEVSAKDINDLQNIKGDLSNLPGVEDVQYQENVIDTLKSWTSSSRIVGVIAAAIMLVLSFLLIMVIIGMRVGMQKRTISIMRLLGATRWYVKRPFMLEGMIYGFMGALLGWGLSMAGLLYILPWAQTFLSSVPLFPIPSAFYGIQLGSGLVISSLIGGFAGLVAASRLIRN
ncbi:ABC transporter permease [Candidatus Woesebacteria bacterium]|nr:ABC transporter permease [Candidatus Woesebacteria bacterium]